MKVYDKPKSISQANIIGLFNLPKCKEGSATELRHLLNSFTSHLASLTALDLKTDKLSELIIIHMIINCLNNYLETEWNKSVSIDEMPSLTKLISFLEQECCNLESMIHTQPKPFNINKSRPQQSCNKVPLRTLVATSDGKRYNNNYPCNVCKQTGHYSYQCEVLSKLPLKERLRKVSHLCANCLSPMHTTDQCKSSHCCKVCGTNHNTILHQKVSSNSYQHNNSHPSTSAHCATGIIPGQVILSTAVVLLKSANIECRALLDNGSQSNFISSKLAKKLGIQSPVNVPVSGINSTSSTITEKMTTTF